MTYSIVYISSAADSLTKNDIQDVFNFTLDWNLDNNISGFLVYKNQSFIQLLEGDEQVLKELFERIKNDERHCNIIPIIQQNLPYKSFEGYQTSFLVSNTDKLQRELIDYLDYIKLLENKEINKMISTVEKILKAMYS
tara:strand:- start:814 stop:1227 length:414 start_codon:yes stop_codon:yes gene_type:complete